MWDQRYSSPEYAYGKEPNDFLVEVADHLPSGQVLCIGEGEGRNAVWLAGRGLGVTALDASAVGLDKARRLARERGVDIATIHADLADFDLGLGRWDGIVSIFCHLPPALRVAVHRRCVAALRPGGVMVLEAYTPRQLAYGSGGPQSAELMMDLDSLGSELQGLEPLIAREREREVHEGSYHDGLAALVQFLGIKPRPARPR